MSDDTKPDGIATLYRANGQKISLHGWPKEFADQPPGSVIGQLRSAAVNVIDVVGRPLSEQNYRAVYQNGRRPEVPARRLDVAKFEQAIKAARTAAAGHLADITTEREKLQDRVTGKNSKPDYDSKMDDSEARQYLRSLPTIKERTAAMDDDPFLMQAALRAKAPRLAGLDPTTYKARVDMEVLRQFRSELADLDKKELAIEKLNANLNQIQPLIDDEKTAVGADRPAPSYVTSFLKDTAAA